MVLVVQQQQKGVIVADAIGDFALFFIIFYRCALL
jgi:hypothetical protein